ncbi:hypothetical protein HJG60_008827 [Phyllostomus discolor]|uniref:Uncharacterized protein n=1 Tax=Phyllostomus discolor TaxID=89673 RepID=A0A834DFY1_9CHIR|nr:hypothetical protein HJG60_008827 [Phyllostomus discolor]
MPRPLEPLGAHAAGWGGASPLCPAHGRAPGGPGPALDLSRNLSPPGLRICVRSEEPQVRRLPVRAGWAETGRLMPSSGTFQGVSVLRPLNPVHPASMKSPGPVHRQAGPEWAEAWGMFVLSPGCVCICAHVFTHAATLPRPAPGAAFVQSTRPAVLSKGFPSVGSRLESGEGMLGGGRPGQGHGDSTSGPQACVAVVPGMMFRRPPKAWHPVGLR